MRKSQRADGNQDEIIARYEAHGATVEVVSHFKSWDLNVGVAKVTDMVEVKDPSQPKAGQKLTPNEQKLHDSWAGAPIRIVKTIDDVDAHVADMRKRRHPLPPAPARFAQDKCS